MEEPKGPTRDWRFRLDARKRNREDEDDHSQEQRPRAIGSSDKSKDTGLCRLGRNCRFNHPKEIRHIDDRRYETESRSWDENRRNVREHRPRDAETQRRSHETESRFLHHKNRDTTPDWGRTKSDWRVDERPSLRNVEMKRRSRHETESRFLQHKHTVTNLDSRKRKSDWRFDESERDLPYYQKTGLCKGYIRENLLQQQHRPRYVETQRRSDETGLRFLQHKNRDTAPDWGRNESEWRFDERRQSEYQKTGICESFMRGTCEYGSSCKFHHPNDRDGSGHMSPHVRGLPMRQDRNTDWKASESNRRFDETGQYSYKPMDTDVSEDRTTDRRASDYERRFYKTGPSSYRPMEKHSPEPMHQDINTDWRAREYETGPSSYNPMEKHSPEPMHQDRNTDRRARESDWRFDETGPSSYNPMERNSAEPIQQAISLDRRASGRFDERRYETESSSRPEKRARTIPDSRELDPRERFEDVRQRRDKAEWILNLEKTYNKDMSQISDGIVEGIKQRRMEEQRRRDI